MHNFCIITLVDIGNPGNTTLPFPFTSSTGVLVDSKDTLETVRLQKANFVTVQQLIQLRANVDWDHDPVKQSVDLKEFHFGSFYKEGKQNIWSFTWRTEQTGAYSDGDNGVAGLITDFDLIPTHGFLQETVTFPANCFNTQDTKFKNTYFIDIGPTDK
jgi:hypothetical protein